MEVNFFGSVHCTRAQAEDFVADILHAARIGERLPVPGRKAAGRHRPRSDAIICSGPSRHP
jgi:hypothetical protein